MAQDDPSPTDCRGGHCSCSSIDRRRFVTLTGSGLAGLALRPSALADAIGGPYQDADFARLVPADKKLRPEWIAALTARGTPESYRGAELARIGMPVGGICTGTLYLGGDGRLWLWDIFNGNHEGIAPKTIEFRGQQLRSRDGSAYVEPPAAFSPVEQGFAITWADSGGEVTRTLDGHGFSDVTFAGEYPVGRVEYRDQGAPVVVALEAFSPFIPLNPDDSGLPATILRFTVRHVGQGELRVRLTGWLQNAVGLVSGGGTRKTTSVRTRTFAAASHAAEGGDDRQADRGTMALALLTPTPLDAVREADQAHPGCASVAREVVLAAGAETTVTFVVAWHFPNLALKTVSDTGRYYAARFASATAVVEYVAANFTRLHADTLAWRDTWLDSTLPHWFLMRTFATASTLATTTCHRLRNGRFYAWEGVGCCPGTCTHVWHYAQAVARLFPQLERDLRERTDLGLAFSADSGLVKSRGETGGPAVDGQAGCVLRTWREHLVSADDAFLQRNWPKTRLALTYLMRLDADGDGLIDGAQPNTLDTDWFGRIPWISSMYHAAVRAGEAMARELGDAAFADRCAGVLQRGMARLDETTWREDYGYYVQVRDEAKRGAVGSYDGCHIDQVLGQAWAWQVGLGRTMGEAHCRRALRSLWQFNFTPDVGPFRAVKREGRWYAMPGEGGLLMVTHPFGRAESFGGAEDAWTAGYFNECMSGFEYQVAAHMIWERMVEEGLAVTRMIHDRYHPSRRNPYNEVECSDHYARAMAGYGVFLAACGFEYHGPKGHIGFAPRLTPDDFRAAFTAAEGWGTFAQKRDGARLLATLSLRWGSARLRSLSLELPEGKRASGVAAHLDDVPLRVTLSQSGRRLLVTFSADVEISAGSALDVAVRLG